MSIVNKAVFNKSWIRVKHCRIGGQWKGVYRYVSLAAITCISLEPDAHTNAVVFMADGVEYLLAESLDFGDAENAVIELQRQVDIAAGRRSEVVNT